MLLNYNNNKRDLNFIYILMNYITLILENQNIVVQPHNIWKLVNTIEHSISERISVLT